MWVIYRVSNGNIRKATATQPTVTKPGFAMAEVKNPPAGLLVADNVVGWRRYADGHIAKLSAMDLQAQLKADAATKAKVAAAKTATK